MRTEIGMAGKSPERGILVLVLVLVDDKKGSVGLGS